MASAAPRALAPRHFPSGGTHRRHISAKGRKGGGVVLAPDHSAIGEGRTLFPKSVRAPGDTALILKSGHYQRKLGAKVLKGRWRGRPIYALTLEERKTCPRSCPVFTACYGNGMHWAHRIAHGRAFEDALFGELAALNAAHPAGFVVRLHVLGDFYSPGYVLLWIRALATFPALAVFGFTARQMSDPIGRLLRDAVTAFGDRFAMRWSGEAGRMGSITIERAAAAPAGAIVCPAQQRDDRFCGNCTFCFTSDKPVAFWRH